jgi:hypothetical protein
MKKITFLFSLLVSLVAFGQTSDVTFQVDMNNYAGSFTTPEINGTFNNWCGNCAVMTDANNDGIWEVTVTGLSDSIEFKFSYDNWAGQESLQPGSACTKTSGSFTNRFMHITGDTTLAPVCWESCGPCSGAPSSAKVTFRVDVTDYAGTFTDINLNGTFNNWCGACAAMTSMGNNIYELEVIVPADTIEYKFTSDGWTDQEMLTQGLPCTKTVTDPGGTFTNRYFVPSGDTILPIVCWEACEACSAIGINENNWIKDFKVTPNPNNGIFDISGSLSTDEDIRITVIDMQGRLIYEASELNSTISRSIDISSSKQGMYILNISSDSNVLTEKIIYTN